MPYHIGSAQMAYLAIYAAYKNKFWQMNDILYQLGETGKDFNTRMISEKVGIDAGELSAAVNDPSIKNFLLRDVRKGMKLNILGTPTFVVNNQTYIGFIPSEIFEDVIQ